MKIFKMKIYSLIIWVLLSSFTFAQNAEAILNKVSANYKAKNSYYIKFKSELENSKTNTKDQYSGEVYVKKEKYNLSVPAMNIQQIYTGKKLYTVNQEIQEVTVTQPEKNSDELFTPTRVLDIYKKGYTLSVEGKEYFQNKDVTKIKLTPTKSGNVKYIIIGVNEKNNNLVYLQEVDLNDTKITISVEKQLFNIIVPYTLLNFDKKFYKNYYISEI